MTSRGPLLTLLAVVVFGAVLFAVNVAAVRTDDAATTAATGAAPPSAPVAAPAPTAAPPVVEQAVFAGRSPAEEITVAIAVKGGRAVAYVCDGSAVEAWFDGTLVGDRLSLTGRNGAQLTGTATPDSATGEVTVGTRTWSFTARVAGKPAGLYEGRADVSGVANRIGWIVLPDGVQVGVRSAPGAGPQPAPPLDPTGAQSVVLDGVVVQVQALDGTQPVTNG